MIKLYPPRNLLQESDILKLEQTLQIRLPVDYRNALPVLNGAKAPSNKIIAGGRDDLSLHEFFEINAIPTAAHGVPSLFRAGFLPIATDHNGNNFFLSYNSKTQGQVYFGDHNLPDLPSKLQLISKNLEIFLESITPFDWLSAK